MKSKPMMGMVVVVVIALVIGAFTLLQKSGQPKAGNFPPAASPAAPEAQPVGAVRQAAAGVSTQDETAPFPAMTDSVPPAKQPPDLPTQLPAENALLRKGMIDSDRIGIALKAENFAKTVTEFEANSRMDGLASEMTNAYRMALEAMLNRGPGGRLERFSCGLSLCAGSIRSTSGARLPEDWWEHMNAGNKLSIYAFTQDSSELSRGSRETRFIFSTSQANNGFYISASP